MAVARVVQSSTCRENNAARRRRARPTHLVNRDSMHSTREVYASSMAPVYWVQIAQLALAAARPRRGFDRLPLKDSFTQSKHCALPRFVSPGSEPVCQPQTQTPGQCLTGSRLTPLTATSYYSATSNNIKLVHWPIIIIIIIIIRFV